MEEYSNEQLEMNKKLKIRIAIIILIILFLLCVFFIGFGKITFASPTLIPTGNVDIFDINGGATCKVCEKCNTTCSQVESVFHEIDEKDNFNVIVYDDVDLINNQVNLRIFDRTAYEYDDKIAPGMYNSYHFIVRNNNSYDIIYNLKMYETNKYNINMKYRLSVDGEYVIGDDYNWVKADKLIRQNISLSADEYHTYNLDWKWFDSDNDTYVGENAREEYKLDINVTAIAN